jgi:hypothetical protein
MSITTTTLCPLCQGRATVRVYRDGRKGRIHAGLAYCCCEAGRQRKRADPRGCDVREIEAGTTRWFLLPGTVIPPPAEVRS